MDVEEKADDIDEALYNRQLYVLGHDAMRRMARSRVLVVGLGGLGVEIAKNLALMGVQAVSLHDSEPAEWMDLASNFYISESDLGRPRAEVCAPQVAALNKHVRVEVHSAPLDAEELSKFAVVVVTNKPMHEQIPLNAACRARGVKYVSADVHGVFARMFCDFGDSHVVADPDGEEPVSCVVSSVTTGNPGTVTVTEDQRHNLQNGDVVTFSEVRGMAALNDGKPRKVEVTGPFTFTIGDTSGLGSYEGGGRVLQVKQSKEMHFRSLEAAVAEPGEFLMTDFGKLERSPQLHAAFLALDAFRKREGRLPRPGNAEDAAAVASLAAAEGSAAGSQEVLRWLSLTARGSIAPMCAAVGGVMAQEALKAVSGKFTPLHQWCYLDAMECLPSEPLAAEEYAPRGDRYDGQVAVLGRSMQERLLRERMFLVGAGAIGCEMLKNWALMGVGCSAEGRVTVTDMDRIERSNLSRQFLFRDGDIGRAKSTTAAAAARAMNPALHVEAMEARVGAETESLFTDAFFEDLTCVCTALDNVEARLYVDSRCVFYGKPLLESGTLGTKGNTQVVVPGLTEHYGATRDPPEKGVPVCTLKNFPYQIEHTIQWARDWLEGAFRQTAEDVNMYLGDTEEFQRRLDEHANGKVEMLRGVQRALTEDRPLSFEHCVAWARLRFEDEFSNQIKQLLHNFPPDQLTSEGTPFWSGTKRVPQPLSFDPSDPTHMQFVIAAANLRAFNYGLVGSSDPARVRAVLDTMEVPPFAPREGVAIATTDEEMRKAKEGGAAGMETAVSEVMSKLPKPSEMAGFRMEAVEFEKDDDTNFHMDLITAAANLRARNYRIEETDKHTAKRIAGRIIPAIATTTALVTGLVCLELYKVLQRKPLEAYRSCFLNLALPLFAFSEPSPPVQSGKEGSKFTVWDKLDVEGPKTLRQLVEEIEGSCGGSVQVLSCGVAVLMSFFMNPAKRNERMDQLVEDLAVSVGKKSIPEGARYLTLEACCVDDDDEDVDLPSIRYKLNR